MIDYETLQRLHVWHHNSQQIVRVSRHQIALHHLGALSNRLPETQQGVF